MAKEEWSIGRNAFIAIVVAIILLILIPYFALRSSPESSPVAEITEKEAVEGMSPAVARSRLTVFKTGSGQGIVASSLPGINCGEDCTEDFPNGTTVTLEVSASGGSQFIDWSGACAGVTAEQCTVTLNRDKAVIANFLRETENRVIVVKQGAGGGEVISSPAGIRCGSDCSEQFREGTDVELTATPSAGSSFTGWSNVCSGLGTCRFTARGIQKVIATFSTAAGGGGAAGAGGGAAGEGVAGEEAPVDEEAPAGDEVPLAEIPSYTLQVTKSGFGAGRVLSNPTGINCGGTCSYAFPERTYVQLDPTADVDSQFLRWTGCERVVGKSCYVNMTAAKSVEVYFRSLINYTVGLDLSGSGSVSTSWTEEDGEAFEYKCAPLCSMVIGKGVTAYFFAEPMVGNFFKEWGGACFGFGAALECSLVIDGNKAVDATFRVIQYSLKLTKTGSGDGKVTSSPFGIQCERGCRTQEAIFDHGQRVTLTVSTLYDGSLFGGWTGACAGAGAVPSCTVDMNAAKEAGVIFTLP